ncbi:glycosyltransferase family 39 protein [Christiangramia sp. SM2212]|uniref:Glycosyltransferase family 39 protein n=1 Tax=Christiangramia sediminicola TaxID=3073267 RepID=A0ABU1ENZ0_9FLAO|nr:glycosyltransferase family 39 protein [Christiangramia sp. SM2212]MDR5589689.1 glycosyltransferase family 39 protein [Christiangramia sp. SM2212]
MEKSFLKIHLLALFGASLLLIINWPYDLGFTPDSISYLEVARNLTAGDGVVNNEGGLVNHWPPLFALSISFVSLILNIDEVQSGTILMSILFYLFLTVNMNILRLLKVNNLVVLIFGFCLIFSPVSLNFINFLSEGLFLVLLSISFYFFLKWMHNHRTKNLLICALSCSLFFLTRYAGIAFIGCYCLYLFFFNKEKLVHRSKTTLSFVSIFVLGVMPWFIYQTNFEKPKIGREIAAHIIPISKIQDFGITIVRWFLGSKVAIILFAITLILCFLKRKIVMAQVLTIYKMNKNLVQQIFLFLFFYPLLLVISISFFDSYTPINNRILSPLLSFILILFFLFLNLLNENKEKLLFMTSALFLLLSFSISIFPSLKRHYVEGSGYSNKAWVESQTLSYLKKNTNKKPVFSNGIELGKLHLNKDFNMLPRQNEPIAIDKLIKKIKKAEAKVVFFEQVNWRNYLVSGHKLKELVGEDYLLEFKDGFIIENFIDE